MIGGILLILVLVLVGGAIAYIGDNVGRRVGKRRITLMGLRPKHTSIIVTIVTGFLITGFTFGALFATSGWVRAAFFGLDRLRGELKAARAEHSEIQGRLDMSMKEISLVEKKIAGKSAEIGRLKKTADATRKNVKELEAQRVELLEAKTELEAKKAQLEKEVGEKALRLGQASKTCLYGDVIFKRDQALARLAIPSGAAEGDVRRQLDSVVEKLFQAAGKRGAVREESFNALFEFQKNDLMKTLVRMREGAVLEVLSATNVLEGEPLIVRLAIVENRIVIRKGEEVGRARVRAGTTPDEVEKLVGDAMRAASKDAHGKGMVPDMETGEVPVVSARALSEVVKKLSRAGSDAEVALVAAKDARIADQLEVEFKIKRERE